MSDFDKKLIHSQTREIVMNLINYMTQEAKQKKFLLPPWKVLDRVVAATKIPRSIIQRIKRESRTKERNPSPKTKASELLLDPLKRCDVRRTVTNLYVNKHYIPTLEIILKKLIKERNFYGGKSALHKFLKSIGFFWQKRKDKEAILIERQYIRESRYIYLRDLQKYREEGRKIIYMDEIYVESSVTEPEKDPLELSTKNKEIVINASTETGLIGNCLTILKFTSYGGDNDKSFSSFIKWLKQKLLPTLKGKCALVVNNDRYYYAKAKRVPTMNSSKEEMLGWLARYEIPVKDTMLISELFAIITENKEKAKVFTLEDMMEEYGHKVLRLPPDHADLNPMEICWSDVKSWNRRSHPERKAEEIIQMCHTAFQNTVKAEWEFKCMFVKATEEQYMKYYRKMETMTDSLDMDANSVHGNTPPESEEDVVQPKKGGKVKGIKRDSTKKTEQEPTKIEKEVIAEVEQKALTEAEQKSLTEIERKSQTKDKEGPIGSKEEPNSLPKEENIGHGEIEGEREEIKKTKVEKMEQDVEEEIKNKEEFKEEPMLI